MIRKKIYCSIVKEKIRKLVNEYQPYAIYITGSFVSTRDWKLGLSDIDIKVLTANCTNAISLKEIYEYGNEMVQIPINISIYRKNDFEDLLSYKVFLNEGKVKESEIILEQLYVRNINQLVYGQPIVFPNIEPKNLREYANANYKFYKRNYDEGNLVEELKRAIFAARIYYFLWNGQYIYDIRELLENIRRVGWEQRIIQMLGQVISSYSSLELKNSTVFNDDYLRRAFKARAWRKRIYEYLSLVDREHFECKLYGAISERFICHGGFIG